MDRKKLGSIVFADRKEMFKLEAIVWPTTKKAVLDKIEVIKTDKPKCEYPAVVVEAAMLLDADWHEFLDGLWIVTAPPDSALQRLVNTRDMTEEDAQQRLNAQLPRRGVGNLADEVEAGRVSAVIENNGGLQELREALKAKLSDPKAWY
jgi:dephospho-CoA kinase